MLFNEEDFRILICGGRHFYNYSYLEYILENIIDKKNLDFSDLEIISGHCEGADKLGEKFAEENSIRLKIFPADWKQYGRAAGPIRNKQMIDYISRYPNKLVLAFVSPNSKGTKNTIELAKRNNIEVIEIPYEVEELPLELFEGIRADGDNFEVDWENNYKEDIVKLSSLCIKETKFNKNLRFYGYKINKDAVPKDRSNFLHYIKGEIQDDPRMQKLIYKCIESFYEESPIKNYDYILKTPSKSKINDFMVEEIKSKFDNCKEVDLIKKPSSELSIDWDMFKASFKRDYYDKIEAYLKQLIDSVKKDPKFSISKISPKYRKYLTPMISVGDQFIEPNSNILIIDDTFTTGTTINMIIKDLERVGFIGNISILTLFNN